jgi:hypothetical protein
MLTFPGHLEIKMSTEIIVALMGIIGIVVGAWVNQWLSRKKTDAEIDKIKAEAEKTRAESYKLRADLPQRKISAINEMIGRKAGRISALLNVFINLTINTPTGYKEHPSPAEIVSALDKLNDYEVDSKFEDYKDLKIKWHLTLIFFTVNRELVYITCKSIETRNITILLEVRIADYPELKLVKKGQTVWVSGMISRISRLAGYIIYLSDCLLEFD